MITVVCIAYSYACRLDKLAYVYSTLLIALSSLFLCHSSPQVLKVDLERKAIVIKGSVPGKPGAVVEVMPAKIVGVNC